MKKIIIFLLLCTLLVGCSGSGGNKKYYIDVTIQVQDEVTGEGLEKATVITNRGNQCTSNSGGTFVFKSLNGNSKYTFKIEAANYTAVTKEINTGKENISIIVKMSTGKGTITGIILDEDNKPLSNVTLIIEETTARTTTDENGVYVFDNIAFSNEGYTLKIDATGYAERTISNVKVTVEQKSVDLGKTILSDQPGTLTGKVVNSSEEALNNVTVNVIESGQSVITDYKGTFTLEVLPGTYSLNFTHNDYENLEVASVLINPNKTTYYTAKMNPKKGSLTGVVVDNNLTPVQGIQVNILGTTNSVTTVSNGYFEFLDLVPGTYTIEITHTSFKSLTQSVTINNGMETNLGKVTINEKTGMLSGRVIDIDINSGVSNATVKINELGQTTTTDTNGYFYFSSVRIGTYTIEATNDNYSLSKIPDVIVKENAVTTTQTINLFKNPGIITGVLLNKDNNKPLEGVRITVLELDKTYVITDESGNFIFPSLRAGVYSFKFELTGYAPFTRTNIVCTSNSTLNLGNVTLTAIPGSITGITNPSARVTITELGTNTTANSSGAFTFVDVTPGKYSLKISQIDYYDLVIEIVVNPATTTDLGMKTLSPILGHIVGTTNATTATLIKTGEEITVINSLYSFKNLVPGNYTIRLKAANYISRDILVTVLAGKTVDTGEIKLTPEKGIISGYVAHAADLYLIQAKKNQPMLIPGYFEFTDIEPGTYAFKVNRTGYHTKIYELTIAAGETIDLGNINLINTAPGLLTPEYESGNLNNNDLLIGYTEIYTSYSLEDGMVGSPSYEHYFVHSGFDVYLNKNSIASIYEKGGNTNKLIYSKTMNNDIFTYKVKIGGTTPGYLGSATVSFDYRRDVNSPKISIPSTWVNTNTPYSIDATFTDYSGVARIKYLITNSLTEPTSWMEIDNVNKKSFTHTFTIKTPGLWYLHLKVTDIHGNETNMYEGPYLINEEIL